MLSCLIKSFELSFSFYICSFHNATSGLKKCIKIITTLPKLRKRMRKKLLNREGKYIPKKLQEPQAFRK